ncbi:MAG TPA: hypothetical protein VJ773_09320 [Gemmatimonadales bacterium]|nr:hypothetical protein [Gemmatimonadales bacterium]
MSPIRSTAAALTLAAITLAPPVAAQIITERAPTTSYTTLQVMSDATPPAGVTATTIPAGVQVSWQAVAGAVGYTLCRESPPGSATCTSLTASRIPATATITRYHDVGLPPGGTHAYRVTAWRADQHFGTAAPVSGTAGNIPSPASFRVVEDKSGAPAPELLLGWDPPSYYTAGGEFVKAGTFRFLGTGITTAQTVTSTSQRVVPGSGDHQWQVTAMIPNPAGGWFESATPATLSYRVAKYRLVALGFKVLQEATDPPIDLHGQGNEVYAAATVTTTTTAFAAPTAYTLRGATYGDVSANPRKFPGRIAAGSALRSGGLVSGDVVPAGLNLAGATSAVTVSSDPKGKATDATATSAFPMLLWEGRLNDQGMIVVHPTLWEEDPDHSFFSEWSRRMERDAVAGYTAQTYDQGVLTRLRDNQQVGPGVSGFSILGCQDDLLIPAQWPQCLANGQDRPLGLTGDPRGIAFWFDRSMVLTQASIDAALRGVGTRPGTSPGTIVVPLLETGREAKASYELYLRVERLP